MICHLMSLPSPWLNEHPCHLASLTLAGWCTISHPPPSPWPNDAPLYAKQAPHKHPQAPQAPPLHPHLGQMMCHLALNEHHTSTVPIVSPTLAEQSTISCWMLNEHPTSTHKHPTHPHCIPHLAEWCTILCWMTPKAPHTSPLCPPPWLNEHPMGIHKHPQAPPCVPHLVPHLGWMSNPLTSPPSLAKQSHPPPWPNEHPQAWSTPGTQCCAPHLRSWIGKFGVFQSLMLNFVYTFGMLFLEFLFFQYH